MEKQRILGLDPEGNKKRSPHLGGGHFTKCLHNGIILFVNCFIYDANIRIIFL